ncbi:MAG: flavodoxin family protein [Oscillospiraceae bacterium]|nr:flavodoxin family protein [Oscillospiraceae bacterium]
MNALLINGSPRKEWNTAKLLKEAQKGAESAGADTKLINLIDLKFSGCVSCFGCKRKGGHPGSCAVKDDLTEILEYAMTCGAVIIGSPVYCGDVTGMTRNFIERFAFMNGSYSVEKRNMCPVKINSAFIYTMNVNETTSENYRYIYESNQRTLSRLNGKSLYYLATDTYQFDDYDKYEASMFDEPRKRANRESQFPEDCSACYDIGKRLAEK